MICVNHREHIRFLSFMLWASVLRLDVEGMPGETWCKAGRFMTEAFRPFSGQGKTNF